ncbi:DNA topoisomerase IV, alpha subunit, partial [Ramicandelaber brevisporus]
TVRGIYYRSVNTFQSQSCVERIIANFMAHFKATRSQLNICASPKGLVFGALRIKCENGQTVDYSAIPMMSADIGGFSGHTVPLLSDIDTTCVQSNNGIDCQAQVIFVIEKEAVFKTLLQSQSFWQRYWPCLIVTGKGYPDIATRVLLRALRSVPMVGIVDYDPHGLDILLVYKEGSKSLQQQSDQLILPDIEWLRWY